MITFSSHVDGYHDVSDQMVHQLRSQAEALLRSQQVEKATLVSVAQFERRRRRVRQHFLEAIGGLPETSASLRPQRMGVLDRGGYTIEKIIYESLPNVLVTAALYLPRESPEPAPAVVFVHGHSDLGKAYPVYQAVCVDLVHNGFVVLAIDPPGQGERKQFIDPETGELIIAHCTEEHTAAGLPLTVSGANLARYFIWDTMRGVDYLETRPEVDARRIGITGNSGGGTQTSYLMLTEPRFAAAVPCTFPMTLESYMKTGQSQDAEQIIRGCFVDGPDHDDYILGMAPKPVLIGAAAYDFFPIEGTLEVLRRAKRIYGLYGSEDNVDVVMSPTRHAYSPMLRQAAVNWFRTHLQDQPPDFQTADPDTLPEEALWCTTTGQVATAHPNSRTIFDLSCQWLDERQFQRRPLTSRSEYSSHVQAMRDAVVEVLGIDLAYRAEPIRPRVVWEGEFEGYRCEKVFFFSQPDVIVTGVMCHPHVDAVQTDIVLFEHGTEDGPAEEDRLKSLLAMRHRLFVFDVRGTGAVQVRPVNRGNEPHRTEYKLGCDALMMKGSTLGMRVLDVLRCYDYLKTRGDIVDVSILGVDSGAVFAYFAAALEDGIKSARFENLLLSYRDLVRTRYYRRDLYNLKLMAWGMLRRFDLVDLVPCLASRKCEFVAPRNAYGIPLRTEDVAGGFLAEATSWGYMPGDWRPSVVCPE